MGKRTKDLKLIQRLGLQQQINCKTKNPTRADCLQAINHGASGCPTCPLNPLRM